MDKRNESINKQIIIFIDKLKEYNINYERKVINEITDQQELFKILSEENKQIKNIVTKINKIQELKIIYEKLIVEIPENSISVNSDINIENLDEIIAQYMLANSKLNEIIKENKVEIVEETYEEPKINIPTITNMEDIKRAFFSNEYEQFTELIKQHNFTFYTAIYKYSSDNDGKPEFVAKNLVGGFIRNLEDFSKYFMICFRCYKVEDNYYYPSFWIVNTKKEEDNVNQIQKVIGDLYNDFTFTAVNQYEINNFLKNIEKKINTDNELIAEKYLH